MFERIHLKVNETVRTGGMVILARRYLLFGTNASGSNETEHLTRPSL